MVYCCLIFVSGFILLFCFVLECFSYGLFCLVIMFIWVLLFFVEGNSGFKIIASSFSKMQKRELASQLIILIIMIILTSLILNINSLYSTWDDCRYFNFITYKNTEVKCGTSEDTCIAVSFSSLFV